MIASSIADPDVSYIFDGKLREYLVSQYKSSVDYFSNDERSGIFLSTTINENTGRLLIATKGSPEIRSCSGVALNSEYFLTAGHCVCDIFSPKPTGYRSCEGHLRELSLAIFFPQRGLVSIAAPPILHEKYKSPSQIVDDSYEPINDLVVIPLGGQFPFPAIPIGRGVGRYITISFGQMYFTIKAHAKALNFPADSLQEGVSQASKLDDLYTDPGSCGPQHVGDGGCSIYNGIQVRFGPHQTSTVCGGDSGAPIFQQTSDGNASVVGITSFFSPGNPHDRCMPNTGRRNHYILLELHEDWLAKFRIGASTKSVTPECVSGIFPAGTIDLLNFRGRISVTSFNALNKGRPEVKIANKYCKSLADFGVSYCEIPKEEYVPIATLGGFSQITLCGGAQ
ncbi:trypsin-like serine protease [Rhizobium leguminosarum]|uniref:trypsin-like serine protease n=1 Tax=Rhizobium leguminosarum TaxID=384 RepID=UPI0013EF3E74|nr:trypsin-like serine protease [Rhizobium leguminosarum]